MPGGKTEKRKIGDWGEERACVFLSTLGYNIIERNFQKKFGEIDIIAWHDKYHYGKTLCFVEVKTRGKKDGSAERATGRGKQLRLFKAARAYCQEGDIDIDNTPIQFEQVSVYPRRSAPPVISHYVIPID